MCLCQFCQNPPIGSEDRVQTRSYVDADADKFDIQSAGVTLTIVSEKLSLYRKKIFWPCVGVWGWVFWGE